MVVMLIVKRTTACVLLVFLCAAWLSTARLHPAGPEVNDISAAKASVDIGTISSTKENNQVAVDGNLKKLSAKQVARKSGNEKSTQTSLESKRSLRTRLSDKVDAGFVAFTADYHSPRHHPPKNNK